MSFIRLVPKKYTVALQCNVIKSNCVILRHGHIAITNYKMGDNKEFEKCLSTWDKMYFKYELVGGYYVKKLKEFRINRGFNLLMLKRFFPKHEFKVDNNAYPCDKIDVKLYTAPRDDFQRVALTFMASQGEFRKNLAYTQQLLSALPGKGKTYCGIASTAFLSARTLIIVPISILLKQWKESYLNFTSLEEDEIMIVQGSKKCEKILAGECKDVKVFLVMIDTLLSFHKTHGDMETIELLRAMNCYTKIVDEVHRDMKSLSLIEALSNFRMNYYLSASPGRSDQREDWIFNNLFMNMPKFGAEFTTTNEKHINVLIKKYRFFPTPEQIKQMYRPNVGLNSNSYEKVLLNALPHQKEEFVDSVKTILAWTKRMLKKKNKILFMCNTVDGTGIMKDIAEEIYPGECSRYYATGLSKSEKEKALKAKVIIATQSSVGTGTDIPGIQFVLNMTTYSSKINSTQLPGRARALKDGTPVMYIEFVNVAYRATYRQFEKRKPFLKNNAKDNKIMMVD